MTRLLVVSADTKWIEYLQLELGLIGIETRGVCGRGEALAALREKPARHFDGLLISALGAPGRTQNDAQLDAVDLLTALRKDAGNKIPIVLWSRFPAEHLSRIASRFDHIRMLSSDTAATIKAALNAAAAPDTTEPRFATVELEIGATDIRALVAIGGERVVMDARQPWAGRPKLKRLESKFRRWTLWQRNGVAPPRYTDNWLDIFRETGEDLADQLNYSSEKLRAAIADCLKAVGTLDMVYFRFTLLTAGPEAPHPFVHVPFELLYDTAKRNFIRALAPVARRICLDPASRTAAPLVGEQPLSGPILFVKSDAHGSHALAGTLFSGSPKLLLSPLKELDNEFREVCAAYAAVDQGACALELLALTSGQDTITCLRNKLLPPSGGIPMPQILHYAGHSVQADDGSVYLVLPGRSPGQLLPVPISEFATWARRAKLRLILLSSCQSTTPNAVFRLAQAGIPAVVGFRWEVPDTEAAVFAGCLHQALASSLPLARAFHDAVTRVRARFASSPTFASPMLVVQNDAWTV